MEGSEVLRGFTIERILSSDERTKYISVLGRSVNDGCTLNIVCRCLIGRTSTVMHMQV